mgnify:CR=1 FL=1
MIAIDQQDERLNKNVKPADKYIIHFFPNAKFYCISAGRVKVLYPLETDIKTIPYGLLYGIYKISDKFYDSIYTNKYSELVKFYNKDLQNQKKKSGYMQLSLFEAL